MTEYAIRVENVSKSFRVPRERRDSLKERLLRGRGRHEDFWALRNVTFAVERGSSFALIGQNGCGKSTMLKLLANIHRPTSGTVTVDGRVSALLELGAGFHGELTGRENIKLNASILGLTPKQINAAMDEIIDFAGIGSFIDAPVKVYSSGMFVRLGFAIAVKVNPEILLVDEIIAVGDEEFQRKCLDHIYELRKRGTTILIVSHSLGIVTDMCENAIWLEHGEVRSSGRTRDVVDDYLREVNKREAAAEERTDESSADGTRRGSGELRITGLELVDASGSVTPFLLPGRPCTFRLSYRAIEDLPEVVFGLGFVHESGAQVAGPNSGYDHAFRVPAGTGTVEFRVDRVPFQPGQYAVSAAAVDRGHVFDYVDRAFDVRVRSQDAITEPGLTLLPGEWVLRPGTTTGDGQVLAVVPDREAV